ncbi:MAG: NUDIX domain-containing protein, partial [Hyphomicrobiales bacterium]
MSRLRTRIFHLAHVLMRPMTLGMRCAAFDGEGRVFLVRHTYVPGWYLPGGGVDAGETVEQALHRELREEGNLELLEAPGLVSIYFNRRASRRDHVLFYVCRSVRQTAPKAPDREIAESGFFSLDALPEGTTASTRRRLTELGGGARDPLW